MVKPSQKILSKSTANKDNSGSTNGSADATAPPVNHGGVVREKRTRRSIPRDSRPPQRSSMYRGVTRHRWTGRFEAHLWDKNCWNESQNKKGRQVYLGAYDDEEAAAHAYDLAALMYWGRETNLNFPASTYQNELKEMEGQSREEYIGSLRRKSNGFSRGVSKYRGVARHHHNGKWEARIGRVFGNKYLYLGTYATQEEAAIAYDMAAIEYRGINAVTNFDLSRYFKWLQPDQGTIDPGPILPFAGGNDDGNLTENQPGHDHNHNHNMPMQSTLSQGALDLAAASTTHQPRPSSATSAVGLLLRPSELREMVEMTPAADGHASLSPEESSADVVPNTCSFPEDIQTYFEWQQEWSCLEEGDSSLFGELNTFGAPLFHYDLIDSMDEQGNGLSMEW